jgi:hypothetical protein
VRVLQRSLYRAAKANPTRKFGVLYDKVCRDDVLRTAYRQVKANGGAPGIDQQTFEIIEKEIGIDVFLRNIKERLIRKRYKPLPVATGLHPEGRWDAKTAGHSCHHRSCRAGSSEDRYRTPVRGVLQGFLVWLPSAEECAQGPARSLQVAELRLPLGGGRGFEVIFRLDSA